MVISYFVFFKGEEIQSETIEFVDFAQSEPAKAQRADTVVVNTFQEATEEPSVVKEVDKPEVPGKMDDRKEFAAKEKLAATNSQTVYKVKSKAHFYNKPNKRTRRKAFINRWNNSYASIKPLDEKNDFVYVEFMNHLGQTSKGWLRKKDLTATKTYYENNKE